MRLYAASLALLAVAGASRAAGAPPVVDDITWLVSNTLAVPDGEQMRRPADELTQWLQARLPGVALKPVVANAERSWALIRQRQRACHAGAARTPERERLAVFTDTWLVPPPQLIVRQDRRDTLPLDASGAVDLEALLNDGGLRGILTQGRSYGPVLDGMLGGPVARPQLQHVFGGDYGSQLLAMLAQDRADYTIDYPNVLVASRAAAGSPLVALPIKGASEPVVSGIACPRTPWGQAAIRLIDKALGTPEGAALLRDTLRISLPPDTQRAYKDAWDNFFAQRARPTPGL
ncbi:uncharacterized protein (TIGR02285 family) [Pelomonas saccharophila]|uniref:Uncharacterized protein (TIGR02285 family) n=1 Tax=Roseateles saccharophilus TaxID=304 RepID=A0ABU1YMW0_ROSSA|nr:hypothetical protein [Roseateles saccharophilus]MDR7270192.1 uncharacterized protein (TIGR02285 family) [Roseateles saccharophilus]